MVWTRSRISKELEDELEILNTRGQTYRAHLSRKTAGLAEPPYVPLYIGSLIEIVMQNVDASQQFFQ